MFKTLDFSLHVKTLMYAMEVLATNQVHPFHSNDELEDVFKLARSVKAYIRALSSLNFNM